MRKGRFVLGLDTISGPKSFFLQTSVLPRFFMMHTWHWKNDLCPGRASPVIAIAPHQFVLEELQHLLRSMLVFICMSVDVKPESSFLVVASSWMRVLSALETFMQRSSAQMGAVQICVQLKGERQ